MNPPDLTPSQRRLLDAARIAPEGVLESVWRLDGQRLRDTMILVTLGLAKRITKPSASGRPETRVVAVK